MKYERLEISKKNFGIFLILAWASLQSQYRKKLYFIRIPDSFIKPYCSKGNSCESHGFIVILKNSVSSHLSSVKCSFNRTFHFLNFIL